MQQQQTMAKSTRNEEGKQVCIHCGLPIDIYDQNPRWAKYEKKWSVHYDCYLAVNNLLDRETGIASERRSSMHKGYR